MKKVLTIVLAAVMILSSSMVAFAGTTVAEVKYIDGVGNPQTKEYAEGEVPTTIDLPNDIEDASTITDINIYDSITTEITVNGNVGIDLVTA